MAPTSILSSKYKSNTLDSMTKDHEKKISTLLVHPHGMTVLKEYKKIKDDEGLFSDKEKKRSFELQSGLLGVILEKETEISSTMQTILQNNWQDGGTSGEHAEKVEGDSQGVKLSGYPDVVLRVEKRDVVFKDPEKEEVVLKEDETEDKESSPEVVRSLLKITTDEKGESESIATEENGESKSKSKSKPLVSAIFEISVDKNGGVKKHLQAHAYSKFIKDKGDAFLFFVMHVDRGHTGCKLAITQECFIYCDRVKDQEVQKYGFLWREFYIARSEADIESTLKKACEGIVRSIHCSTFLQKLPPCTGYWKTFHDNVAVAGSDSDKKEWVYKVFDNRHQPTQRNPDNWLNRSWTKHLDVKEWLDYEETAGARKFLGKPLGKPALQAKAQAKAQAEAQAEVSEEGKARDAKKPRTEKENPSTEKGKPRTEREMVSENMPVGEGAIVVIQYKYQEGTHIASKVSHLQSIAESIQDMHKFNMVHGDIRGHNLLHPLPDQDGKSIKHPLPDQDGKSIKQSCLIDFDLSGTAQKDKYPIGLSSTVPENGPQERKVKGGQVMEKAHDWVAFGAAIGVYALNIKDAMAGVSKLNSTVDGNTAVENLFAAWDGISEAYRNGQCDMNEPTKLIDDFIKQHGDKQIDLMKIYKEKFAEAQTKGTGSPEIPRNYKRDFSISVSQETEEEPEQSTTAAANPTSPQQHA